MASSLRTASRVFRLNRRTIISRTYVSAPPTVDPLPTTRHQPSLNAADFPPSADPQLDGYPELPSTSYQYRSAKGWDDVQDRRNIGELVPEEYEALSMWTPDAPVMTAPSDAVRQLIIAVMGFVAFGVAVKAVTPERPAVPRSYPYDGLVKELGGIEENKAIAEPIEGDK
ncbi:hypothetical protein FRB94_012454 [Tulasnella sp. JGI-2019a]|nr:hypothetical protein FRB94_012454 [Tulasnella sp. JGI-2019a]KAG9005119.1 hypothetical protein FRB93_009991 [Tulasnella sp. JGI-2019a]KAG9037850.1 hypothetical protein FRB95_003687 [Tulasnella sp. JGI-2019a]